MEIKPQTQLLGGIAALYAKREEAMQDLRL
jgi:hypothetical protein